MKRFFDDLAHGINTMLCLLVTLMVAAVLFPAYVVAEGLQRTYLRMFALALTDEDVHIDVPLSNMAVRAFNEGNAVGEALFPTVSVDKRSDKYYTITKADWLRLPQTTLRGPKQAPKRGEWSVSSDSYYAHNYAYATDTPFESLANQDRAIRIRERNTLFNLSILRRDKERRIANKVTSITNVGSGVSLAGANKWSDRTGSAPIDDVNTGHAFIRGVTGFTANLAVIDYDTMVTLRRHPQMLELYKYVQGGQVSDQQIAQAFRVQQILIADAIVENAIEGGTSSITGIWGNVCFLAHVEPARTSDDVMTFGLNFRWTDPQLGAPMAVRVYNDPDPGKRVEITEAQYYDDEKIVAKDLAYLIRATL